MLAQFAKWFAPSPTKEAAHRLYIALVSQSRQPFFYSKADVADTIDGRFDMILLHLFFITQRLRAIETPEAEALNQDLVDTFVSDMDRSLREMGVGDTGIKRRVKAMGFAMNGRLTTYAESYEDAGALREAIARNIYREHDVSDATLDSTNRYAQASMDVLSTQTIENLQEGLISWPDFS